MKKFNLFLFISIFTSTSLFDAAGRQSQTIYMPTNAASPISHSNTAFLWDFHDVIAQRSYKKSFLTVWNSGKKFGIIRKISPIMLWQLIGLLGRSIISATTSEELVQLVKKYNNTEFEKLIIEVANAQEPIQGTVDIIQELAHAGHKHYIGSNIGASIFADIIDPSKYPQFAELFSYFNLDNPQTVSFDYACPKCTIRKPNLEFYQAFLTRNNIDLNATNVIFIDDRLENVIGAQKAGMIGIRFISPEQLRADLRELGVFESALSSGVDFRIKSVV